MALQQLETAVKPSLSPHQSTSQTAKQALLCSDVVPVFTSERYQTQNCQINVFSSEISTTTTILKYEGEYLFLLYFSTSCLVLLK